MAAKAPLRMTVDDVMRHLADHGNNGAKTVLKRHGARDPFFGTRIADMKTLTRKIRKDYELSLALYDTGNSDAMYFAGLIADETRMTEKDLRRWVEQAYWYLLAECTVAWVASETPFGAELARDWIESEREMTATAGWSTFSSTLAVVPAEAINLAEIAALLARVENAIHGERNRVRYAMNSFVISVGAYIPEFTHRAKDVGRRIGTVTVDMGQTECKVPLITPYIEKIEARGTIGRKKKTARC